MTTDRRLAACKPPDWVGDLDDDCTANWAGFILRAEQMDEQDWWWCVYDGDGRAEPVASSNFDALTYRTGTVARQAAERAAREFLELPADR